MANATFYLDYLSPYAYLAWEKCKVLSREHQIDIDVKPVMLAALLNHHGHKGPAEIPTKKLHTFKHVLRLAKDAGLTLAPPPSHPFNPLLPLRLTALTLESREAHHRLVDTLFKGAWQGAGGVDKQENVQRLLDDAGFKGAELIARATTPENKAHLKGLSAEAIELGLFGVPTLLYKNELFWGFDSVGHLSMLIDGSDPCQEDGFDDWLSIEPSASRV